MNTTIAYSKLRANFNRYLLGSNFSVIKGSIRFFWCHKIYLQKAEGGVCIFFFEDLIKA